MEKWKNYNFVSSTTKTPEFKQFARDFRSYLKKQLKQYHNLDLESFNVGHFDINAMIFDVETQKYVYINTCDVRNTGNWYKNMLYRTAKHNKDWSGGGNHYSSLNELFENIKKLLSSSC